MNTEKNIVGIIITVAITLVLLANIMQLRGILPHQKNEYWQKEIVSRGYGKFVPSTNNNQLVEFQWITNKIVENK